MKRFVFEGGGFRYSAPSVERLDVLTEKGFAASDESGFGADIENGPWGSDDDTHE